MNEQLSFWHQFVKTQNLAILENLLADDVRFHSPFVWKPKEGKLITMAILNAVTSVFEEFSYVREIINEKVWALEFEAKISKLTLRGVDLIELNDEGKIIDFEVMVRPANALQLLGNKMSERLKEQGLV